ncbi:hypothetical protein ACFX2K_009873 [Malus domestica]
MRTTRSMVGGYNTRHIEEDDIKSLTRGQSRGQESRNVGSSLLGIQGDVAGTTADSSQRQQVLLAEEELLEVPIQRDDGWKLVSGSIQKEVEEGGIAKLILKLVAVTAGPKQPQVSHDLLALELSWSWVGHGSSGPAWAN